MAIGHFLQYFQELEGGLLQFWWNIGRSSVVNRLEQKVDRLLLHWSHQPGSYSLENNPSCGGALDSGRWLASASALASRWSKIFLIIRRSSIQAMILTSPPHRLQTETSILKTRLSLSAHVSNFWQSVGDFCLLFEELFLALPLPRFAGFFHGYGYWLHLQRTVSLCPCRRSSAWIILIISIFLSAALHLIRRVFLGIQHHLFLDCIFKIDIELIG